MRAFLPLLMLLTASAAAQAATSTDANAALGAAEAAEAKAGELGNRWLPAETALKAARAALAKQDWDAATKQAIQAKALADQSIVQSHEQDAVWRDAILR